MKTFSPTLICAALAFAASSVFGADEMMKKPGSMMKDGMDKPMTMDQCKEHMAMAKKDGTAKRDEMMMKKDTMCADMMKKGDGMMKKDEPMKK